MTEKFFLPNLAARQFGLVGIEPTSIVYQTMYSPSSIRIGWGGRTRTPDMLSQSQPFCQLNYTPIAGRVGFEPTTLGLTGRRSTS